MKPVPKIRVNAEFQRLLWLNGSWGVIIGILLLYALFLASAEPPLSDYLMNAGHICLFCSALAIYLLITRSIRTDLDSNSFDQLRMSSLSAWQMTWARLLVAPLAGWVLGILGIGSFLAAELLGDNPLSDKLDWLQGIAVYTAMLWSFACAVLINALQFKRGGEQWSGMGIQPIALVMAAGVFITQYLDEVRFFKTVVPMGSVLLISAVLLAVMLGFGARATMAYRLHLQPSNPYWLCAALLSPLLFWWTLGSLNNFLSAVSACYGVCAMVSLAMQDNRIDTLRAAFSFDRQQRNSGWAVMPIWAATLLLGLLAASLLSLKAIFIYMQIGLFAVVMLFAVQIRLRYNTVTLGLVLYLLLRLFWSLLE